MLPMPVTGGDRLFFSYGQFLLFDDTEESPEMEWTPVHTAQGFARRSRAVAFSTLSESGHAQLRVFVSEHPSANQYDRIVAVPLELSSGVVHIEGVEEYPATRTVKIPPGFYRVYAAQRALSDEQEELDIYFVANEHDKGSAVVVADAGLRPPEVLIDHADPPADPTVH